MKYVKIAALYMLRKFKSPSFWAHLPKNTVLFSKDSVRVSLLFSAFFILLLIYFIEVLFYHLETIPVIGLVLKRLNPIWGKTLGRYVPKLKDLLEKTRTYEVKRSYLINLAFENLRVRKSRSLVTVAGMSFGVGVIVLLLSLGYGIERLVINKVATLQDLQVIDISTGGNTAVKLTRDAIRKFEKFADLKESIPLVSVVGRVTLNKATTDVLVYSAPNEYFKLQNLKLLKGKLFTNNTLSSINSSGAVAGASTSFESGEFGKEISPNTVLFNINPETEATVWDTCSTGGKILGFATRIEGGYKGHEYWGSDYYPFEHDGKAGYSTKTHEFLGKWVKGVVALYDKNADGTLRPSFDEHGVQEWADACVERQKVQITNSYVLRNVLGASIQNGEVLAASDSAGLESTSASLDASESAGFLASFDASVVGTSSAGIELVDLAAQQQVKKETKPLTFKGGNSGEAIVSTGLLNLLNVPVSKALSTTFNSSIILGKSQIPELAGKAMSEDVDYKIIGIIDDPDSQYFYIPLQDVKNLGISNYSQAKLVIAYKNQMAQIRKHIEGLGFRTTSTADTVAQIENLFANIRIILGLLGMVALGVASLGMFNTLTVSLLERTREIGGMKAIGMVADEVQELLLSEAMIMGLSGGIGGLVLGFIVGKLISVIVSIIAITGGQGFLDLTYIPPYLVIFIFISSFIVGLLTGLYPAIRARKISALNALRYE